jgi:hypothetical protein
MEDERPVRVWVHPALIDELNKRKEILEEETGYKINGGMPIVSKICALELKKNREKDKKIIRAEIHKVKGIKKNEIVELW